MFAHLNLSALALPASKRDKYVQQIDDLNQSRKIWPGDASKVAGRGEFTTQWCWSHVGRAFMWPLRDHSKNSGNQTKTQPLVYALAGMKALYEQSKPRLVMELGWSRRRVDIFTDGRGNLNKIWGSEFLGGRMSRLHFDRFFPRPSYHDRPRFP